MNVAITGSSGFIGKNIVNSIKQNFPNDKLILIDQVNGVDILNIKELETIEKFDIMIHLAAKSYVPESFSKPYDYYYTNAVGTLNILEMCKRFNAKLIYLRMYKSEIYNL